MRRLLAYPTRSWAGRLGSECGSAGDSNRHRGRSVLHGPNVPLVHGMQIYLNPRVCEWLSYPSCGLCRTIAQFSAWRTVPFRLCCRAPDCSIYQRRRVARRLRFPGRGLDGARTICSPNIASVRWRVHDLRVREIPGWPLLRFERRFGCGG